MSPPPTKIHAGNSKESPTVAEYYKEFDPLDFWVGGHYSVGNGPVNALNSMIEDGGSGLAFFPSNPRGYAVKPYSTHVVSDFVNGFEGSTDGNTNRVLVHAAYIVNPASPDEAMLQKTMTKMIAECKQVRLLGLQYYNFHPGSTKGEIDRDAGLRMVGACINTLHKEAPGIIPVIEMTAGSKPKRGEAVGYKLGDLISDCKKIIDSVEDKDHVGVCVDTCHIYAAGYDISTTRGCDSFFREFDEVVGLKYLLGMHINGSKTALGSHHDKHASLYAADNQLGDAVFYYIMNDKRFKHIPLILETPDTSLWSDEINWLRSLVNQGKKVDVEPSVKGRKRRARQQTISDFFG
ncbi:hypothetical protein PCE1_000845 [Barthelona sp. PCE]